MYSKRTITADLSVISAQLLWNCNCQDRESQEGNYGCMVWKKHIHIHIAHTHSFHHSSKTIDGFIDRQYLSCSLSLLMQEIMAALDCSSFVVESLVGQVSSVL